MIEAAQSQVMLLVEDNPADAEIVLEMLNSVADRSPFEIIPVTTLSEAERTLASGTFDVVVLDLRLPDASGLEAVRAVVGAAPNVPVVVLTGMEDERLGEACIEAGAQDYLSKNDLKPIVLRQSIGYAITRLRTAQFRDLQSLLGRYRSLSSPGRSTNIAASFSSVGPLRESHAGHFCDLVKEYSLLLDVYMRKLAHQVVNPKELMERLATALGDYSGGPRDLIDVHLTALEDALARAKIDEARVLVMDGRLLALDMMGLLVDYYRLVSPRPAS